MDTGQTLAHNTASQLLLPSHCSGSVFRLAVLIASFQQLVILAANCQGSGDTRKSVLSQWMTGQQRCEEVCPPSMDDRTAEMRGSLFSLNG
ncbi:hypothetical protein E2C01_004610 [Portunus trituberculatus]|uniref:Uncharacterized protein n=1 Tax=Portunus trituberculatus TaxID=210409 RepID=A0A5B7CTF7_PORTR|nr:hypothetical protein [Portunus trituberculatus]